MRLNCMQPIGVGVFYLSSFLGGSLTWIACSAPPHGTISATTVHLTRNLPKDIHIVSTLQYYESSSMVTCVKVLCEQKFSFLWNKCPEMWFLVCIMEYRISVWLREAPPHYCSSDVLKWHQRQEEGFFSRGSGDSLEFYEVSPNITQRGGGRHLITAR